MCDHFLVLDFGTTTRAVVCANPMANKQHNGNSMWMIKLEKNRTDTWHPKAVVNDNMSKLNRLNAWAIC